MSLLSAVTANVFAVPVILFHLSLSLPLLKPRGRSASIVNQNAGGGVTNLVECAACKEAVKEIQYIVELNWTFVEIYPFAVLVCESMLKELDLDGEYMCPGIISAYGPVVQYVAPRVLLDPATICYSLHYCHSKTNMEEHRLHGPSLYKALRQPGSSVPLRKSSPFLKLSQSRVFDGFHSTRERDRLLPSFSRQNVSPISSSKQDKSSSSLSKLNVPSTPIREQDEPASSYSMEEDKLSLAETITFLQISDIHFDVDYAEGSPTDCSLSYCCRSWYSGTGSAGHYGDYNCDLPKTTLDLLMDEIRSLKPAPDFIVYTGDNSPHNFWNQSWSSQLEATRAVVGNLSQRLPDISIYPSIGNHETWPESEYMGTLEEYQALTRNLSVFWKTLASDLSLEAEATVASGGYYSTKVSMKRAAGRSENTLRIISFNSNYGYMPNFYSFLNGENPEYSKQWSWLQRELAKAKDHGEKVLLIGHIPPGGDTNWPEYGEFYLNITRHYKDTIVGHLFGHTHLDQFELVQDETGVYGVVLVAPSVTPYNHANPSFRSFTMDAHSKQLLSYTQHHLDLPLANDLYSQGHENEVRFEPAYSTTEEYNLQDLSPASWSKLAVKFKTDPELLNKYYYNQHGRSLNDNKICNAACQKDTLCEVNNIISTNVVQCKM